MQVIRVGDRPVNAPPRPIRILNAGGGGLAFRYDEDLAIRRRIVGHFQFTVAGQTFQFHGELVRKQDDRRDLQYAVQFIDVDTHQQDQLVGILGRMQLERERRAMVLSEK
jgi:hypothetical protein